VGADQLKLFDESAGLRGRWRASLPSRKAAKGVRWNGGVCRGNCCQAEQKKTPGEHPGVERDTKADVASVHRYHTLLSNVLSRSDRAAEAERLRRFATASRDGRGNGEKSDDEKSALLFHGEISKGEVRDNVTRMRVHAVVQACARSSPIIVHLSDALKSQALCVS